MASDLARRPDPAEIGDLARQRIFHDLSYVGDQAVACIRQRESCVAGVVCCGGVSCNDGVCRQLTGQACDSPTDCQSTSAECCDASGGDCDANTAGKVCCNANIDLLCPLGESRVQYDCGSAGTFYSMCR
jgi:hypothetical protein